MPPAVKRLPGKREAARRIPVVDDARSARGDATRQRLLEIAGEVFGEFGFAGGTTKEIARRAGTPMASINYHFGSREALYECVLVEAHGQLLSLDALRSIVESEHEPPERFRLLLGHLARMATSSSPPWGLRVIAREAMSPSAAMPALVDKAAKPKAALLLSLVSKCLGLEPSQPAVQRALCLSVLPCVLMMVAPRESLRAVLPQVLSEPEAMQKDFLIYAEAGLAALAKTHAGTSARKARSARIAARSGAASGRSSSRKQP